MVVIYFKIATGVGFRQQLTACFQLLYKTKNWYPFKTLNKLLHNEQVISNIYGSIN